MPEIKQAFTVGHSRPAVWAQFQDLPKVVACIRGATFIDQASPAHARGRMTVRLGPVRADFAGEVDIAVDAPNYSGTITGTGIDKSHGSRAKGTDTYKLEDTSGGRGTIVPVFVDYKLSGSLAQFTRGGIVEAVADQICREFTANLEDQLDVSQVAPSPLAADGVAPAGIEGAGAATPAPQPVRGKPSELNVLKLLVAILKRRIRSLFGGR